MRQYPAMLPQGFYTVRYSDGKTVSNVPVEEAIKAISASEVDVILFNRYLSVNHVTRTHTHTR